MLENEFTWRGVSSRDMGVVVQEMPSYKRPARRLEKVVIPGRNGEVVEDLFGHDVWEDVQYTINLAVKPGYDRVAVMEWLSGDGELVLGSIPDSVYRARIEAEAPVSELAPGHAGSYLQVAPTFVCGAWRYERMPRSRMELTGGSCLGRNPYDYASAPLIGVEGDTGTVVEIAVDGRVLSLTLTESTAMIDCDLETAQGATTGGDFLTLPPGAWEASMSLKNGAVTDVWLSPRYRRI